MSQADGFRSTPGKPKQMMTSAASAGYALVSAWDKAAILSENQLSLVELLASACVAPPLPEHIKIEVTDTQNSHASDPRIERISDAQQVPLPGKSKHGSACVKWWRPLGMQHIMHLRASGLP